MFSHSSKHKRQSQVSSVRGTPGMKNVPRAIRQPGQAARQVPATCGHSGIQRGRLTAIVSRPAVSPTNS